MPTSVEYQDLLYFGYDVFGESEDNRRLEQEFITEITTRFPTAQLKDAYDEIKGFRQEVHLEKELEDQYFSFLIGKGWLNCSMSLTLLLMESGDNMEHKATVERYVALAKEEYPENFKPEAL
jgi:hypothetical protein